MKGALHRLRSQRGGSPTAIMSEGLAPAAPRRRCSPGYSSDRPIYGFQSLAAMGVAVLFRLNKPLTFAATFINNPVLQPFLVVASIGLGRLMLTGITR